MQDVTTMNDRTLGVVGTKLYTQDCMEALTRSNISVDYLVTLTPEDASDYQVAGYRDLRPFAAEHEIEVFHPEEYGLRSGSDSGKISDWELDLLLVVGWSRLIPSEILESLRVGALGAHGSPEGLPRGRGRAVLNWALINLETQFRISTFFLEPNIDDGDIIATQTFEINNHDTASTLRHKTWWAFSRTIIEYFDDIVTGSVSTVSQEDTEATYYPKRLPEDGGIDWSRSSREIHAFVRALTRPYPGAFTILDGQRIYLWDVVPFDSLLPLREGIPGRIATTFADGTFVVETPSSTVLVREYDGGSIDELPVGTVFESVDHEATLEEIRSRYPDFVKEHQKEV